MLHEGGWAYHHQLLGESALPDGTLVPRPCVPIVAGDDELHLGVIDSGSPITVASRLLLESAGVEPGSTKPVMEVPLGIGGSFASVPMFEITVGLAPPFSLEADPVTWTLLAGRRDPWRHPFGILFGQRGWFDQFTTTIGEHRLVVEPLEAFDRRFPG